MIKQILSDLYSNFRKPRIKKNEKKNLSIDLVSLFFNEQIKNTESIYIDDQTANDLDIDEVFLQINHTTSKIGEQYLYNSLRFPTQNINVLLEQNKLAEYFTNHKNERDEIKLILKKLNDYQDYHISTLLFSKPIEKPNWFKAVYYIKLAIISSILASFFFPKFLIITLFLFCCNFYLHFKTKERFWKLSLVIARLSTLYYATDAVSKKINWFENGIKHNLKNTASFVKRLKLTSTYNALRATDLGQLLFSFLELINILFLIEVYYTYNLDEKSKIYKQDFITLFFFIGKVDLCVSVSELRETLNIFSLPEFVEEKSYLEFEEAVHPLIKNCTPNDFVVKERLIFINGSNMSGKTTFIRTIAINILLANSIYTCLSKKAKISSFNIYTSIRIQDDINDGKSYFLSELIRLKEFVELSSSPAFSNLFLIDEMLKGTNISDRSKIAQSILQYLQQQKNNIIIITSHDIDIVKSIDANVGLFHFKDDVYNNDLSFDYRINEGLSIHSNATKLLALLDFPQQVIENAI